MDVMELEAIVRNIDRRLSRVEQILPSLATKEDLKAFATKDDLREESELTRQHFNAVAERLESHIRLIVAGHVALQERIRGDRSTVRACHRGSGSASAAPRSTLSDARDRRPPYTSAKCTVQLAGSHDLEPNATGEARLAVLRSLWLMRELSR